MNTRPLRPLPAAASSFAWVALFTLLTLYCWLMFFVTLDGPSDEFQEFALGPLWLKRQDYALRNGAHHFSSELNLPALVALSGAAGTVVAALVFCGVRREAAALEAE